MNAHQGYAPDKVMWTHKDVNLSRRELSRGDFVAWCVAIATYRAAFPATVTTAMGDRCDTTSAVRDLPLFEPQVANSKDLR